MWRGTPPPHMSGVWMWHLYLYFKDQIHNWKQCQPPGEMNKVADEVKVGAQPPNPPSTNTLIHSWFLIKKVHCETVIKNAIHNFWELRTDCIYGSDLCASVQETCTHHVISHSTDRCHTQQKFKHTNYQTYRQNSWRNTNEYGAN